MKRKIVSLLVVAVFFCLSCGGGEGSGDSTKRIVKMGNSTMVASNSFFNFFFTSVYADLVGYTKVAEFDESGLVIKMKNYTPSDSVEFPASFYDNYVYDAQNRVTYRRYREREGNSPNYTYPDRNAEEIIVYDDLNNTYLFTKNFYSQSNPFVIHSTETRLFELNSDGNIVKITLTETSMNVIVYEYSFNADKKLETYKNDVDPNTYDFEYVDNKAIIRDQLDNAIAELTYNEEGNLTKFDGSVEKTIEYTKEEGKNESGKWFETFLVIRAIEQPDWVFVNL